MRITLDSRLGLSYDVKIETLELWSQFMDSWLKKSWIMIKETNKDIWEKKKIMRVSKLLPLWLCFCHEKLVATLSISLRTQLQDCIHRFYQSIYGSENILGQDNPTDRDFVRW